MIAGIVGETRITTESQMMRNTQTPVSVMTIGTSTSPVPRSAPASTSMMT